MNEEIISKEEFDSLMKINGEVKGVAFMADAFILKEEGEEGLKRLYDVLEKLGFSKEDLDNPKQKYKKLYPMGWSAVSLLAIKRLFNYDNKKIEEMGRFQVKISSLIMRFFMKYFISLKDSIDEAPKIWRRYYTVGNLKVVECNEEKRYRIDRLENFNLHPLLCEYIKGYLSAMIQIIVKTEVSCEEVKCVHRGDKFHEFLMKW